MCDTKKKGKLFLSAFVIVCIKEETYAFNANDPDKIAKIYQAKTLLNKKQSAEVLAAVVQLHLNWSVQTSTARSK